MAMYSAYRNHDTGIGIPEEQQEKNNGRHLLSNQVVQIRYRRYADLACQFVKGIVWGHGQVKKLKVRWKVEVVFISI